MLISLMKNTEFEMSLSHLWWEQTIFVAVAASDAEKFIAHVCYQGCKTPQTLVCQLLVRIIVRVL